MAEGKKSFIAYADWKAIFDELPNEDAGGLIKHIFAYVNDENPVTDNILIRAVFANIKSTLKRDLQKWESKKGTYSKAGIESGKVRSIESKDQVYIIRIYNDLESFIKIGTTSFSIKKRFSQSKLGLKQAGYEYEIISQYFEEDIPNKKILDLERFLHESLKNKKYHPKNRFSGHTECFIDECLDDIERLLISFNECSTKSNETERNSTVSVNVSVSDNGNDKKENISPAAQFVFKSALVNYGFSENLVLDWLKVRKKKKATDTETAFNGFISEVKKCGAPLNDILKKCVEKSWAGFEAAWYEKEVQKTKPKVYN